MVVAAPGRYSYPTSRTAWPYGAGALSRRIKWDDAAAGQQVSVSPNLTNYALAAGAITVIVGDRDVSPQPKRPAHVGDTRLALAKSWVAHMKLHTTVEWQLRTGQRPAPTDHVTLILVPGTGHHSHALVAPAIRAFEAAAGR